MHVQQSSQIEVTPENWLRMGLSPVALDLLRDGMTSSQFAKGLIAASHFDDAVRVVAHVLPVAVAVKWALSSIRQVSPASLVGAAEGVASIEAWLADPTDARRRTVFSTAEASGLGTPVGSLGLAVFLSGGSIAPPSAPEVLPQPGLAARGVIGALMMAAVFNEPQTAPAKVRHFAEAGAGLFSDPNHK